MSKRKPRAPYVLKKVVRESHKQDIDCLRKHPSFNDLFLTASSEGKQIHLFNNNHCEGHLDLVSHYNHRDTIGGVCWANENIVSFYDSKGRVYLIAIHFSRIEVIYEPMTQNEGSINFMCSSYDYFNNRDQPSYLFMILDGGLNVQIWNTTKHNCTCNISTSDDATFVYGVPVSYNQFLIFQSDGTISIIALEGETVTISKINLDPESLLSESISSSDIKHIHLVRNEDDSFLFFLTSNSLVQCFLNERLGSLEIISHQELEETFGNVDSCILVSDGKPQIMVGVPMGKHITLFKADQEGLEEFDLVKHNKKGASVSNAILFSKSDEVDHIIAAIVGESSILRLDK